MDVSGQLRASALLEFNGIQPDGFFMCNGSKTDSVLLRKVEGPRKN
jgi:hypothetical protein